MVELNKKEFARLLRKVLQKHSVLDISLKTFVTPDAVYRVLKEEESSLKNFIPLLHFIHKETVYPWQTIMANLFVEITKEGKEIV